MADTFPKILKITRLAGAGMLKEELLQIYTPAAGTNTYTATLDPVHTFVEGDFVTLRFQHTNTGASTFNGTAIVKSDGTPVGAGDITADMIATLQFDGASLRMPAAGGGGGSVSVNGTAVASPNFNQTTPAAPGGGFNITWQSDVGGNISAYIPSSTYDTFGAAATAQSNAESFATSADATVLSTAEGYTDAQITARAVLLAPAADQTITAHNLSLTGAGAIFAAPIIDATTGFEISGAAPSGHYLRGDGTHYVDGTIQAGDVPSLAYLPLVGGTLTGDLLFSTDNAHDIGASGATRPRTVFVGTSVLAPLFNAATGFQIAGAAASGHYLRGNGTDYVDGTIQAGDVPSLAYLPLVGGTLTGDLLFSTDNTHDIGATGATRPRTLYIGTSAVVPELDVDTIKLDSANKDVILVRDTAFVAAFKNGTNPMDLRIYGTTTGPKYLSLRHDGTDGIVDSVGGGILKLEIGGVAKWQINTSGDLLATTDNSYDIGAVGATRPRSLYLGTQITVPTANVTTMAGNPDFTGAPTTTTAAALSDNTQVANTKYVDDAVSAVVITGALPPRSATIKTTGSLQTLASQSNAYNSSDTESGSFTLYKSFEMQRVTVDRAARVRLYRTAALRDADLARSNMVSVTAGTEHGLLVDLYLDGIVSALDWWLDPIAEGYNGDAPQTATIYYNITNMSSGTHTVQVTFYTVVQQS